MPLLKFWGDLTQYELEAPNLNDAKPVDTDDSLIVIEINNKNEIVFLDQELVGDYLEGNFEVLKEILERIKPEGLYTVPELGLNDVPFDVVLERVKAYYKRQWEANLKNLCK